jgi:hypothetical protein
LTKAGAENYSMIEVRWAPWQEERPVIKARVIAPDGTIHELDSKTIAETQVKDSESDVLTDRKSLRAPLPAMEVGSVVEQEISIQQTSTTVSGSGCVRYFFFGESVPVQQTKVEIVGPEAIAFRYRDRLLPQVILHDNKQDGVRTMSFEQGPMKALSKTFPLLPPEEPRSPHIVFSTAADWHSVAAMYSTVVEINCGASTR